MLSSKQLKVRIAVRTVKNFAHRGEVQHIVDCQELTIAREPGIVIHHAFPVESVMR